MAPKVLRDKVCLPFVLVLHFPDFSLSTRHNPANVLHLSLEHHLPPFLMENDHRGLPWNVISPAYQAFPGRESHRHFLFPWFCHNTQHSTLIESVEAYSRATISWLLCSQYLSWTPGFTPLFITEPTLESWHISKIIRYQDFELHLWNFPKISHVDTKRLYFTSLSCKLNCSKS